MSSSSPSPSTPNWSPAPAALDALIAAVRFDAQGLVPAIAQDARTGAVRMLAWANAEALRASAASGLATFWSRSRASLWRKGDTSGNRLRLRDVRLDCDGDAVLYVVDAEGPSCHTGATSCFFRAVSDQAPTLREDAPPVEAPAAILDQVASVITQRRHQSNAEKSYVASLLRGGWPKILGKIKEEAGEVAEALPAGDKKHIAHEAADVIFHLLVGLELAEVPVEDVFAELRRRFGTSGLTEKANRPPKAE